MAFIRVQFFPSGTDGPVKSFLDNLVRGRPRAYLKLALDLEVLGADGMRSPQISVRSMGAGLWELRRGFEGVQYRIFFCIEGGAAWLLHAIEKKGQKTPLDALRTARLRMRRVIA